MNWFKRIWKALSEPVPLHTASGDNSVKGSIKVGSYDPRGSFTPRAQQALALARTEAERFHHNFVGTEHLLLGLIRLGQGVAVNVLLKLGLDLENVRKEIENQVGTGPDQNVLGYIPYTPRVKKVLSLAAKEAKALNHTYVGTEHILLGLLREGDGVAGRVLKNLKVNMEQTRREILKELDPNFDPEQNQTERSSGKHDIPAPSPDTGAKAEIPVKPRFELIDLSKRYDIYCSERNQEVVVYRNALFKGVRRLFREDRDSLADFFEIEQADGQPVFVAKYSVIKFCESGGTPSAENIPGRLP